MNIKVEQAQGKVPVTVMTLEGELDASSYLNVIEKAKVAYDDGTRDLLLNLNEMSFMASSGLVALHSVAMIMRGEEPPDPEGGWGVFSTMSEDVEGGVKEAHCKILSPQPRVDNTLEMTGFKNIFEIYTDMEEAIASFG